MNAGFVKDLYRKGNSVKRSRPFSEHHQTLKIEKLLPSPPSQKSALKISFMPPAPCPFLAIRHFSGVVKI